MKARGAAIQGGLAGVALLAAYFAWQREPARSQEEVVVFDARKDEVTQVRYDDAVKFTVLQREGDAVWVTTGSHPPPPSADAGVAMADGGTPPLSSDAGVRPDAGVPAPRPPPAPTRTLRGNDLAEKLVERFAPLRATRSLGTLPEEKLRELGLLGSPRRVDVSLGDTAHRFKVSAVGPSGGAPYLQADSDQRVYLIPSTLISDLESAATRLVDRRLHVFKQGDYDEVTLTIDGDKRTFVQTGTPPQMTIAPRATPNAPDDFAKNWLDKVYRFVPTELLGRDELPAGGAPEIEARVDYSKKGAPLGFIELGRVASGALYARSEHTAGWVKVQLGAKEVLDDAQRLIQQR